MAKNKNNTKIILIPTSLTIKLSIILVQKYHYITIRKLYKIKIYCCFCCCFVLLPIILLNSSNSSSYNMSVKLGFIFKAFS